MSSPWYVSRRCSSCPIGDNLFMAGATWAVIAGVAWVTLAARHGVEDQRLA